MYKKNLPCPLLEEAEKIGTGRPIKRGTVPIKMEKKASPPLTSRHWSAIF
jgi:hypothetical protein